LVYRLGFLFIILGNILYMVVAYYLWRAIYSNSPSLNGLTFDQAFLYVALGSTVFIMLKTYADWGMAHEIQDGTISVLLTKPVDYQLYTLYTNLGFQLTNIVAIAVPTVLMLIFIFRVRIPPGPGYFFFPLSLVLAFIISFHFDYLIGLVGFYTESIWGISTTKEILITVLSGALLPLQFFPTVIRQVLEVLPFQAIYYTPLMTVTIPNQGVEVFFRMVGVQLFWAAVTYVLCRVAYGRAIKVLRIAGG
jgi:ABC-2 type transport system permease protein